MHLAPEGFRIRLMEPGEAEALRALGHVAGLFQRDGGLFERHGGLFERHGGDEDPAMPDFVRWLLRHEVFVAEAEAGGLAGFAAARDAVDLYFLSALAVDPAFRGRGVRKALLKAVVTRAGWFFHRAVGLVAGDGAEADWFRRHRCLGVERADWTPAMGALAAERPGSVDERSETEGGDTFSIDLVGTERVFMIHWL